MKRVLFPEFILAPRVTIWRASRRDAREIAGWAHDPTVRDSLKYFSFFQKQPTLMEEMRYIDRMTASANDWLWVIRARERNEFIGTVGLHEIDAVNDNLRIGIIIFNKNFQRQGYATDVLNLILGVVFESAGMNKVYLTARADNEQAIRIYEKLGFKPEGVLRQEYKVRDGEYIDLLRMSILRSEWEADRLLQVLSD